MRIVADIIYNPIDDYTYKIFPWPIEGKVATYSIAGSNEQINGYIKDNTIYIKTPVFAINPEFICVCVIN